jgi:hypothetical protein
MNLTPILYSIGSIGPFASRVFLPALVTALLLRFGAELPLINHLPHSLIKGVAHAPPWFTSNPALIALTVLSILEALAQKNPEARQFLHEFDIYLKPAIAVLASLGVLSATDGSFLQGTLHQAGLEKVVSPLIAALGVFRVAAVRRDVMRLVYDHIEGTHLDHLISWAEDAGAAGGIIFVVLLPFISIFLLAAATGILFLIRRRVTLAEEARKLPCSHCGQLVYPSASACQACRTALANPCGIGFFGQSVPTAIDDPSVHPFRLVEKRRCSVCATRLKQKSDPCPACGTRPFPSPDFVDQYVSHVGARLPLVLMICFLLGLIPLLGMILGVVYYRTALVLPFAEYLSAKSRFLLRWSLRVLFLLLIFFQVIPVLGALAVPLLALVSFLAYRGSFVSAMGADRTAPPLAGSAAAM